jgi:hypothetical protein
VVDSVTAGTEYLTRKGSTVTVIKKLKNSKYEVTCSLCSKDKELFPSPLMMEKREITKRGAPCACSTHPKWSDTQYITLIFRECEKRGYTFNKVLDYPYKSTSRLELSNPATGNTWSTTIIVNFLKGTGDPTASKDLSKKDRKLIENFEKNSGYPEGSKFSRNLYKTNSRGSKVYWNIYCSVCSVDMFTKSGVCTGVFSSSTSHISRGKVTCRCSPKYRWNTQQRELQLKTILEYEGAEFNGWVGDGYRRYDSKFHWTCKNKHKSTSIVDGFINKGSRCKLCWNIVQKESGNCYGYYPARVEELDTLYVLKINSEYVKVGRSFDVQRRVRELMRHQSVSEILILHSHYNNHRRVYELEQYIHTELKQKGMQYFVDWGSVECFNLSSLSIIKDFQFWHTGDGKGISELILKAGSEKF